MYDLFDASSSSEEEVRSERIGHAMCDVCAHACMSMYVYHMHVMLLVDLEVCMPCFVIAC